MKRINGKWHFVLLIVAGTAGCFDTREPAPPGQSGLDFEPATVPSIVISNLKNSIAEKSIDNYMRNFSDPFLFVASAEASSTYPNVRDWTYEDERGYFQNLVAKADGFSALTLTPIDSTTGPTETSYTYEYVLTFEHTDHETFPTTAMGNLQFVLEPDASNIWFITNWSDFSTSSEITWSSFKGKFGN